MKRRPSGTIERALLALLLAVLAAGAPAEVIERVVVRVNGAVVTQSEFQARQVAAVQAARVPPERIEQFLRENNAKILQEAIDDLLLVQRADEIGVRLSPAYINEVVQGDPVTTPEFLVEAVTEREKAPEGRVAARPDQRRRLHEVAAVGHQVPITCEPAEPLHGGVVDQPRLQDLVGRRRAVDHPPFLIVADDGGAAQALEHSHLNLLRV